MFQRLFRLFKPAHLPWSYPSSLSITQEDIAAIPTAWLGKSCEIWERIGSTNSYLKERVQQSQVDPSLGSLSPGHLVISKYQTGGRGRFTRTWVAPSGSSLLASFLIHPEVDLQSLPQITLITALSVSDVVEQVTGLIPQIKWPNDVYIEGKKVAGILCDAVIQGNKATYVIVGLGLNLYQHPSDFPSDFRRSATSLMIEASLQHHPRFSHDLLPCTELLRPLLISLETYYEQFIHHGLKPFLPELESRSYLTGKRVRVDSIEGIVLGPSKEGFLMIKTSDGLTHCIHSGEAIFVS